VRPLTRTWRLLAVTVGLVTVASGCSLPTFGAPDSAAEEGDSILSLWQGFFLTALGVAGLVWGLLIYVLLRFRKSANPAGGGDSDVDELPSQRAYNIPVEVIYTSVPILVVAALFGFSVATEDEVVSLTDDPAVEVDVIGFQWSWQFHYLDEDVTVTPVPGADPPELVLPVDQPAHLNLITTDIAHSFWVPDFLAKRDLIPGIDNTIEITPTRPGTYVGRCAEFCGLDHWRMYFTVRVVSEDDFAAWIAEHRDTDA
jgi:cytochrome c oxidase subunit II